MFLENKLEFSFLTAIFWGKFLVKKKFYWHEAINLLSDGILH